MRLAALRSAFMADVRDVYFFSSLAVRRRGERGGDFDYFVDTERFILTVFDTIFAVLCNDARLQYPVKNGLVRLVSLSDALTSWEG